MKDWDHIFLSRKLKPDWPGVLDKKTQYDVKSHHL